MPGTVSILLGNGDGTFQALRSYAVGPNPWRGNLGDLDADGKLDLVISSQSDNSVTVLFGNGDGTFDRQAEYDAGGTSQSAAVGDFNGDGRLDLAVSNYSDGKISVLLALAQTPGTWTATGSMSIGRQYFTATLLTNGKVLVAGGTIPGTSAELYDPSTGTWTPTGSMSTARAGHTATLLPDGRFSLLGARIAPCPF